MGILRFHGYLGSEKATLSQIKIIMSSSASDETALAFLQTKSNKLQEAVPDDVRGDEESLFFFLSPWCKLCDLCGLCGEKKTPPTRQTPKCAL